MDVNALGVMIGIQEAAKAMIAAGTKGKIINTASIAGRTGYADFAPYSASKFAVVALTHAGASALASEGITVNAFAPGVVVTPLWEQLDKDLMAIGVSSAPGEAMDNFSKSILLGHVAQPAFHRCSRPRYNTIGSDTLSPSASFAHTRRQANVGSSAFRSSYTGALRDGP